MQSHPKLHPFSTSYLWQLPFAGRSSANRNAGGRSPPHGINGPGAAKPCLAWPQIQGNALREVITLRPKPEGRSPSDHGPHLAKPPTQHVRPLTDTHPTPPPGSLQNPTSGRHPGRPPTHPTGRSPGQSRHAGLSSGWFAPAVQAFPTRGRALDRHRQRRWFLLVAQGVIAQGSAEVPGIDRGSKHRP